MEPGLYRAEAEEGRSGVVTDLESHIPKCTKHGTFDSSLPAEVVIKDRGETNKGCWASNLLDQSPLYASHLIQKTSILQARVIYARGFILGFNVTWQRRHVQPTWSAYAREGRFLSDSHCGELRLEGPTASDYVGMIA